ncbi:hypothetical protein VMCG_03502 [Cytospora schulzeri]|uniref:Acetylserotonin methytransferase-like protein n=1 Tax=Cytospora schulzeri TaxID=448051 RepID=A0A423WWI3_9PEZI|nr:hypothetical protein VMCG_03502 [Valsa malicola]
MASPVTTTDADERRLGGWHPDRWHHDIPTIQRPAPVVTADPVHRTGTAFSEAQTLVRTNSNRSRSSIAKPPLENEVTTTGGGGGGGGEGGASSGGGGAGGGGGGPLKSIFPEYDPNLPLSQQNYYPPQSSPTHPANIPAGAISRHLYSPTTTEAPAAAADANRPASPLRSPMSVHSPSGTTQQFQHHYQQQQQQQQQQQHQHQHHHQQTTTRVWPPPRVNVQPTTPETSTTEQLRDLWKVANGWKAPTSEGRVYTLRIAAERDAPVYTLSSRTQQPFYRLRLDPTSASAYVSLSRFDPARPYKPPVPAKDGGGSGGGGGGSGGSGGGENSPVGVIGVEQSTKGWQEVISTTLEETTRHHAPEDGLVALLYPSAAARLAIDSRFATSAATRAAAERECARLVWDDDSGSHFLVHPALAMPFCVTVERNPAWSRTEYTLEHIESPQHLARLTRDGTGMGWLEVDTGIAAKIDAVYLADVAVAALMLVAHADGEFRRVEVFEPPPSAASVRGEGGGGNGNGNRLEDRAGGRLSLSRLSGRVGTGDRKEKKAAGRTRMEEFELDLESQASDLKKHPRKKDKDGDKMPGCARAIISLISVTFKCIIWCVTILFKALTGCIGLLAKCVTSEKL